MYRSLKDKVYNNTMKSGWITPVLTDKEKAIDAELSEWIGTVDTEHDIRKALSLAYDKWVK